MSLTASDADSLRGALEGAIDGAVIHLAAGNYTGPFEISRSVTLVGAKDAASVFTGTGAGTMVRITGRGIVVALSKISFEGGGPAKDGGALSVPNGARLVVTDCTFRRCTAPGLGGGAIAIRVGELIALRCRFMYCEGRSGGAVLIAGRALGRAADCQFTDCVATHRGHAVAVRGDGELMLKNPDFSAFSPFSGPHLDVEVSPRAPASEMVGATSSNGTVWTVQGARTDGSDLHVNGKPWTAS